MMPITEEPTPDPCEIEPPPAEALLTVSEEGEDRWILTDGRALVPEGDWVGLDGWAIDVEVHPGGRWAVTSLGGYDNSRRVLQVVDLETQTVIQEVPLAGVFMGLLFDETGEHLYAAGSEEHEVYALDFADGILTLWGPPRGCPACYAPSS